MDESRHSDERELEGRIFDALNHRFPYFIIIIRNDLALTYISSGSERMVGFTPEEMLGRRVDELVHPEDLETVIPMALRMFSTGTESIHNPSAASTIEIPIRVARRGGGWEPMALSGRVFDEAGSILCVLRPYAERIALDTVLYKLSSGAGLVPLLDAVLDLVRSQFPVSDAWVITRSEGVLASTGRPAPLVEDPLTLVEKLDDSLRTVTTETGEEYWIVPIVSGLTKTMYGALVLSAAREGGPSPYDGHVLERTANLAHLAFARAKFDEMLQASANTDHLTGALNRRAVERHISALAKQDDMFPAGVLFADLDGFKQVNDQWGHSVGDDVLKTVAHRISSTIRPGDALGRLGGDEFVVVCGSASCSVLTRIRDRIETSVSQPMKVGGVLITISVSIGLAMANTSGDLIDILHRSDADMYSRKPSRGNGPAVTEL